MGEMFWLVGLGGKPVTRGHSPKSEEGVSSKSLMTRSLKSLHLGSILPVCSRTGRAGGDSQMDSYIDEGRKPDGIARQGRGPGGKEGSRKMEILLM